MMSTLRPKDSSNSDLRSTRSKRLLFLDLYSIRKSTSLLALASPRAKDPKIAARLTEWRLKIGRDRFLMFEIVSTFFIPSPLLLIITNYVIFMHRLQKHSLRKRREFKDLRFAASC